MLEKFYKSKPFIIAVSVISVVIVLIVIITTSICVPKYKTRKAIIPSFEESTDILENPDQGMHQMRGIKLEPTSFTGDPYYGLTQNLIHVNADLSSFSGAVNEEKKDLEITEYALTKLDEFLDKIKLQNKNAVIRFCYDSFSGIPDREPSIEMIKHHIYSLAPILNKHIDMMTAIEAGMVGKWGEMHTSVIATDENKALILKWWLDSTKTIPILCRTFSPIYVYFNRSLYEMEQLIIKKSNKGYRLGIFNDCFLSNDNDYGTYTDRKRELHWLSTQSDHLPFGGEPCYETCEYSDLDKALPEMHKASVSYLHVQDKNAYTKWKGLTYNETYGDEELFYGKDAFHFIQAHLGYRLVMLNLTIYYQKGTNNVWGDIHVKNVGFGNLLRTKKLGLIYANKTHQIIKFVKDAGSYKGENVLKFKASLIDDQDMEYFVYLVVYGSFENNVIYYPIQFANVNVYNPNLKGNLIFKVKGKKFEKANYIIE